MPPPSPPRPPTTTARAVAATAACTLPAVAFGLGGAVLAHYQPSDAAPETAFLALLGGWVLAGIALVAPRGSWVGPSGATFATLALWVLPAGPQRAVVVGALLVASLLVAGWLRLRDGALGVAATAGGALAVHALLRAGELLPASLGLGPTPLGAGEVSAWARVLLLPLLAALAVALLSRTRGKERAMTAAIAAALVSGGFTATAALPLLALAAVEAVGSPRGNGARWRRPHDPVDGQLATNGADDGADGIRALRPPIGVARGPVLVAVAAVAALTVVRPVAGGLAIAAAAARWLPAPWCFLAAGAPLAFALAAGGAPNTLLAAAVLLVLLPFKAPVAGSRAIAIALLLAAGGAMLLPASAGIAAAVVILATAGAGKEGALERGWLAALLGGAMLAGSYPWLRTDPLATALALFGIPAPLAGRAVLVAALVAVAVALALSLVERAAPRPSHWLLATGLAVAALVALPPPAIDVAAGTATLTAAAPVWEAAVSGPVRRLRVVSALADAAALPAGTAVATVSLERQGTPLAAWSLRVGAHTGEWAAERADLGGGVSRGPAWWSWLPPPGDFFAHDYAATWQLDQPAAATRVRVALVPGLAPGLTVSLHRLEITR